MHKMYVPKRSSTVIIVMKIKWLLFFTFLRYSYFVLKIIVKARNINQNWKTLREREIQKDRQNENKTIKYRRNSLATMKIIVLENDAPTLVI